MSEETGHRWWCQHHGDQSVPSTNCTGCRSTADPADRFPPLELPEGWWMCPHHGEEGALGEDCSGCREHWGLDPNPPQQHSEDVLEWPADGERTGLQEFAEGLEPGGRER